MNSRGSWNVEDIDPSVRERAAAAARRAGLSLADWLDSSIGESDPGAAARPQAPAQPAPEVTGIHQRLDTIARQIETISQPTGRDQPPVARQLNEAISRLDERLSRITAPKPQAAPHQPPQPAFVQPGPAERPATAAAPGRPPALDSAISEILARQNELEAARTAPEPAKEPAGEWTRPVEMAALEQQLARITSGIEALHQPAQTEHAIASFRGELRDIHRAVNEAMPRQAIESIEREVKMLARRIEDSRDNAGNGQAMAGVERALKDIRQALHALTPAEQLAGFDSAIRDLGAKLDTVVRSGGEPETIRRLEKDMAALRGIVANVASNDTLAQLAEHVQALASKVDRVARADIHSDSFAALEARIATLTSALENRPQRIVDDRSEQIEGALRALTERLDRIPAAPVDHDAPAALAHLEQRVSYLLERLEASADHRAGGLDRVERGLQDILLHLEQQQAGFAALSHPPAAAAMDDAVVDTFRRELSDIRYSQSESSRATQDTLEAVHNTLTLVVDRLTVIENDLRVAQAAPTIADVAAPAPMRAPAAMPKRPELPNPAQGEKPPFVASAAMPGLPPEPSAIRDILRPRPEPVPIAPPPVVETRREPARTPLSLDLPPDHPLEPGTRPADRAMSSSERIAASEDVLSEIAPALASGEPARTSSFIAAARRAAQAAAAAAPAPGERTSRAAKLNDSIRAAAKDGVVGSKIRALLIGASVVVIVLGAFKVAMTFLDSQSTPMAQNGVSRKAPAIAPPPADAPSLTSPTPIDRQSLQMPASHPPKADGQATDAATQTDRLAPAPRAAATETPAPSPVAAHVSDETGSLAAVRNAPAPAAPAASTGRLTPVKIPAAEKLPEAIGGPLLRGAALKGDPAAAHEVALRYAEGKGIAASLPEAAKWYERAAQGGVVPAMFRLGTFYEKGTGVTKNVDTARRYYTMAAERGNAKAMHNLAVLEADGGGNGANYRSASAWFHKAAMRGVADSQFNLGILYARGIGVEQNLAESFKWFSLAAAQGDADAARKRDDVAKRLDAQSLAAAKLAVTSFTPESQPDDAITVATPPNGWDSALAKTASAKPAPRSARAVR
ncbi:MAG: hypothetical protein M9932_14550 [Xanthobacteraceae bacterium]|nr:hypothetical protein [Xanthobacteraceae bacterium]